MSAGWVPSTKLGKLVASGEISSISQALASRLPLREVEIVDKLVPDMADEVADVNMVQRMTDSGRRVKFAITCVVGNRDGIIGVGRAKGREVGPTIRAAIANAKLNIIEIKRGCGSWQCGCGTPHTLPFRVEGKAGSVELLLRPAPRGVGLAVGNVAKIVLDLAGIKDAWGFTSGHSKTTLNFTYAAFNALKQTATYKVTEDLGSRLKIHQGMASVHVVESEVQEGVR
ncbi:MAG: 30S ribosomal protein S5 [Methanomassiliicoccales archaeon]